MTRILLVAAGLLALAAPAYAQAVVYGTAQPAIMTPSGAAAPSTPVGTVDTSAIRVTLTGSAYTVPALTDLVRFIQTGTIASQTVTLPTAIGDGQPIQFVNYTGAVTALTFSPAVGGWTNGSQLAANSAIRIRWDATAAAWQREQ